MDYRRYYQPGGTYFFTVVTEQRQPLLIEHIDRLRAAFQHGMKRFWQRRFWEHCIRDEDDWHRHLDYIHYNPVKHGYCLAPADWRYSSFDRSVKQGLYTADLGANSVPEGDRMDWE
jgi:REP element-mobilizing transposase RayT